MQRKITKAVICAVFRIGILESRMLRVLRFSSTVAPLRRRAFCLKVESRHHLSSLTSGVSKRKDEEPCADSEEKELQSSSTKDKLKILWRRYGMLFVGTYLSTYVVTLSGAFFTIDSGLLSATSIGVDPVTVIHKVWCFSMQVMHPFFILLIQ